MFDGSSIERMEMILLKVLEWRLCSPTPYSYIQLLESMELEAEVGGKFLMPNITQLLLGAVLDYNLVDFRPSLLAVSAVWCCLDYFLPPITSQTCLSYITRMFNQHPEVNNGTKLNVLISWTVLLLVNIVSIKYWDIVWWQLYFGKLSFVSLCIWMGYWLIDIIGCDWNWIIGWNDEMSRGYASSSILSLPSKPHFGVDERTQLLKWREKQKNSEYWQ